MRSVPRALQAWPSQRRAFFAHPGEVAAAEAAAAIAQRAALRALPAEALSRVDIVASVCTDVPSFLHSQPTLTALAGAAPARHAAGRAGAMARVLRRSVPWRLQRLEGRARVLGCSESDTQAAPGAGLLHGLHHPGEHRW